MIYPTSPTPTREAMHPELDLTKPVVLRQGKPPRQAEDKTLTATKALAISLTEKDGTPTTVFVPHTTYKRKPDPVREIKHKLPKFPGS